MQVPLETTRLTGENTLARARLVAPAIGQRVTLKFGEQLFSQAALLLFGLPLLLSFGGAGAALIFGASAGAQVFGAAAGAVAGWWGARSIGGLMQNRVYESLTLDAIDC